MVLRARNSCSVIASGQGLTLHHNIAIKQMNKWAQVDKRDHRGSLALRQCSLNDSLSSMQASTHSFRNVSLNLISPL